MTTIIKKVRKGNSKAMTLLYNENSEYALYLCFLLLADANAAGDTVSFIFKNMWDSVISGEIETEEEFRNALTDKVIRLCRSTIAKKNNDAFKIPVNKKLSDIKVYLDEIAVVDKPCIFILQKLPPLFRFIYILHSHYGYSKKQLAELFKTYESNIKAILDAEDSNIKYLCTLMPRSTDNDRQWNAEVFHCELEGVRDNVIVPSKVNGAVTLGIDMLCDRIRGNTKRERIRTILCIGLCILAVCNFTVAIWKFAGTKNNGYSNYDNGYTAGYSAGYSLGYDEGYDIGYNDGVS